MPPYSICVGADISARCEEDVMGCIAVITARGGSKRIKGKNIRDFCGKPIICYSISAALESGLFDEVMVSTDSKAIADIAESSGAKIPFMRSEATSGDHATTADVLKEVLVSYEAQGMHFSELCCLYPTAPFVTAKKLRAAHELLVSSDADGVMPVVRFSFPPQRANVIRDGKLVYQYPEFRTARSQDLEPVYHDCGQFYFYKVKGTDFNVETYAPLIIPETEVQDIDNEDDWVIAEMKYRSMLGAAYGTEKK